MSYNKLRGRIREIFGTEGAFAEAMGFTKAQLSDRLNNKTGWKTADIRKAVELLNIPVDEIGIYFFTIAVQ